MHHLDIKIVVLDQTKLVGPKIHTKSNIEEGNFWLDNNYLPSSLFVELVAQAGAWTLAPFFQGTKPQVLLLGCETGFIAIVQQGSTSDT